MFGRPPTARLTPKVALDPWWLTTTHVANGLQPHRWHNRRPFQYGHRPPTFMTLEKHSVPEVSIALVAGMLALPRMHAGNAACFENHKRRVRGRETVPRVWCYGRKGSRVPVHTVWRTESWGTGVTCLHFLTVSLVAIGYCFCFTISKRRRT